MQLQRNPDSSQALLRLTGLQLASTTAMLLALLAACAHPNETDVDGRVRRVERGLLRDYGEPFWQRMNLHERMTHHRVPGLSIAMVNDFEIEWTREYGVLESGRTNPVAQDTLFQAASVGKQLVAVAALHCVEMGWLKLDEDVNDRLVSWKIQDNEFSTEQKVTLRRLLSHCAGTTVPGFPGYPQGTALPNLIQILDGAPPANSPPIRVDTPPGLRHRYSGGGYMVVQQLLTDVTGRPFVMIMESTVLKPCGMTATTFRSPLPEELWGCAASGHRSDGSPLVGRWHNYPEMGAGGSLWSTPSDLARFLIGIMLSHAGRSEAVLSQEMTVEMLTPQVESRALGPVVGDDGDDRFYFMHPGGNEGYRCVSVAYPKRGQAVVIMTNSDNGEALWWEILRSISIEYGWVG